MPTLLNDALDEVADIHRAAGVSDYDRKPFGSLRDATWHCHDFDLPPGHDKTKGIADLSVIQHAGMENGFAPDFDAAKAVWRREGGKPRGSHVWAGFRDGCKGGETTIVVGTFPMKNPKTDGFPPAGQPLGVWMEEMKIPPVNWNQPLRSVFMKTITHCLVRRASAWLLAALAFTAPLHAADRKPNFVFLIADDHRWDAMGAVQREHGEKGRYPWFETPNMDRLAAGGVRFRNAFITHSICSPGRAGFLTGQYTHANGVMDNGTPFPLNAVTHATLLRDAGYQTAYFGKWHMGNQKERPGFQHAASFIDQGTYQNCPVFINGVKTPTKGWIDDVSTDFAIDWLKQHGSKPFSMVIGFKSPHNKRGGDSLPDRLRNLYKGKTTRRTPNCDIAAVYHKPLTEADKGRERGLSANSVHLDYLRHIKGIDDNLGRLLDALDQLGLTDDTVVVYTSDNGYFLGERGIGDKRALYEEGLRIPFIVRYPRLFPKGGLVDEMVINQDLAPTFLDLAGLPAHPGMHGVSFKELARGSKPANWRTSFLAYYRKELGDTPTCRAIRTDDAKLIVSPNRPDWTEVYDLKNDPYELKRLPADGPLAKRLAAELEKRMAEFGFKP